MRRYFISYYDTSISRIFVPFNGIFEFEFDILKNENTLRVAEDIICKETFSNVKDITIIQILPL